MLLQETFSHKNWMTQKIENERALFALQCKLKINDELASQSIRMM